MWRNIVEPDRPHIIWRIRIACCLPKATDTHSEFVILLFHDNNGAANASQCYIILTLPVLLRLYITSGSSCGDMHKFFRPPSVFVHPPLALVGNWNSRGVCVLQWHKVHTKYRENGFFVLKANHTHTHTHTQYGEIISLLVCLKEINRHSFSRYTYIYEYFGYWH
jgi:hypothetical protein